MILDKGVGFVPEFTDSVPDFLGLQLSSGGVRARSMASALERYRADTINIDPRHRGALAARAARSAPLSELFYNKRVFYVL